ncbi:MAG: MATE family efflux transporter [Muribaculaceae bacterium]|nr:MATE family efflux transporter [Muribaculaceae bacterium]
MSQKIGGNNERLREFVERPIGRLLWQYSLPSVVGMVVMSLYNIVDRIFIGHVVGPEAIAGLTVTFPVMNIATAIGVLVGGGAAARVSIMLGNDDHENALRVMGNALVLTLVNAIVYLTFFAIFMDDMLRAFGASDVTLPYAREFMTYLLPGLLLINVTFSFNNIMRASGFPRKAMVTMLIGAGLNIILAPTFIYVLRLGIKGAAIATDISMFVSAVFVLSHFAMKKSTLRYQRGIYRPRWDIIYGILAIGAAPSIVNVASCMINMIINNSLGRYGGDSAVAAAGIFTTYTAMIVSIILGICMGMQPIIGYNYGARRIDRLKKTYLLAVGASTLICLIGWIGGMTVPRLIARCFTVDANLIDVTGNALSLSMICFWVVGFQIISTTLFQSIGKAGKSIFLGLTRQVLFLIPLLYIMQNYFGLDGIWLSFPSSDFCATVVTVILVVTQFRSFKKQYDPERL